MEIKALTENEMLIEHAIFSDLLVVKLVHVLLSQSSSSTQNKKSLKASDALRTLFPPEQLPQTAEAILRRAKVITEDSRYSSAFLSLVDRGPGFLIAKLHFQLASIQDYLDYGQDLIWRPEIFMEKSRVFSHFNYRAAKEFNVADRENTLRWCNYVSALTDRESIQLVSELKEITTVEKFDSVLEVGGNLGVFAATFVSVYRPRRYVILDLPLVADLGREALDTSASEIEFVSGDMFAESWTQLTTETPDTIVFKSVLHDWPEERVKALLRKSLEALKAHGSLIIFERCSFNENNMLKPCLSDVSNLIFAPFYRNPEFYASLLRKIDPLLSIKVKIFDIDMKWFILVGTKES